MQYLIYRIKYSFFDYFNYSKFYFLFYFQIRYKKRINKDMNIKKKMLERTVARQVFIFSYHNTSADLNTSLLFGSAINRENRDETIRYI
jgi:hypothetical protein